MHTKKFAWHYHAIFGGIILLYGCKNVNDPVLEMHICFWFCMKKDNEKIVLSRLGNKLSEYKNKMILTALKIILKKNIFYMHLSVNVKNYSITYILYENRKKLKWRTIASNSVNVVDDVNNKSNEFYLSTQHVCILSSFKFLVSSNNLQKYCLTWFYIF